MTSRGLARSRRTLLLHVQQRAAGERHGRHLDSVISKIRLRRSMRLYMKNNRTEFLPDLIRNEAYEGAVGFLKRSHCEKEEEEE